MVTIHYGSINHLPRLDPWQPPQPPRRSQERRCDGCEESGPLRKSPGLSHAEFFLLGIHRLILVFRREIIPFYGRKIQVSDFLKLTQIRYPLVKTNSLLLKMAIEIVSFPMNSMVIFRSYVKLPEGIISFRRWNNVQAFVFKVSRHPIRFTPVVKTALKGIKSNKFWLYIYIVILWYKICIQYWEFDHPNWLSLHHFSEG